MRLNYPLTSAYQQIGMGRCIISLKKGIDRRIFVNEDAIDTTAKVIITEEKLQIAQLEDKPTYAKLGPGIPDGSVILTVDSAG